MLLFDLFVLCVGCYIAFRLMQNFIKHQNIDKAESEINEYSDDSTIANKIVELTQKNFLQFKRYYNNGKTNWLSQPKGKVLIIRNGSLGLQIYINNNKVEMNEFEQARIRTALGGERD